MSNPLSKKKEVMSLNLLDYSYLDEPVERDTPGILFCKKHDGYTPIHFKSGPGWMGKAVRWLSVAAMGLVHTVDIEGQEVDVPVTDYLKAVLGENNYNQLPPKVRERIGQEVGITVTVSPIKPDVETQEVINKMKAKSLLYDQNIENSRALGESTEKKKPMAVAMDKIPWVLAGMGLTYVLMGLGVLSGF